MEEPEKIHLRLVEVSIKKAVDNLFVMQLVLTGHSLSMPLLSNIQENISRSGIEVYRDENFSQSLITVLREKIEHLTEENQKLLKQNMFLSLEVKANQLGILPDTSTFK